MKRLTRFVDLALVVWICFKPSLLVDLLHPALIIFYLQLGLTWLAMSQHKECQHQKTSFMPSDTRKDRAISLAWPMLYSKWRAKFKKRR